MAGKVHLALNSFHNGLNTKTSPRDIADDNLVISDNISVDDVGRLTMSGAPVDVSGLSSSPTLSTLSDGYSLFRFSSDYAANGTTQADTDYTILWDDTLGKLQWLPGTTTWATVASVLDLSTDWGTTEAALPVFYYVDGALRISDGNYDTTNSRTINPPQWIGAINRDMFPDSSAQVTVAGWKREKQELEKPTVGTISLSTANAASTGVHWHVRNLIPEDSIYTFSDAETYPGAGTSNATNLLYVHSEQLTYADGNSTGSISDENWQTSYRETDGYNGSYYHAFGLAMHGEDDDAGETFTWSSMTDASNDFNLGGSSKAFGTGQSIYVAVRMKGDEQKSFWDGTHVKSYSGEASLSMSISDAYIKFKDQGSNYIEFRIEHTKFTDITTPSAQWHIIEFPYDDAYDTSVSGTFYPNELELKMDITWTRVNYVYSNGTSSGSPDPYNKYREMPGFELIQLSDMRIGDTDLVGVTTLGKQKFLMSYTYDETDNESLLYDFGSTESNELGNVVLENSTSSYKLGITARVSPTVGNNRVTGANLYMEDDGIPYRIAQLRYMKGLKGAWESEYPTSDRFVRDSGSPYNHSSSTIKTDGLPLLESYEAMNGFSPNVDTNIANYKTATILNRRTYIANVYQNGEQFSDRMIKSNANSFDVFPSEGKGIDVVKNDGDTIIKLESYADRILQFKKNVMYLINATRDSEYLEDTFVGKGIPHPSASTTTDIGVAWVNENGCFFYDGEKVNDLTQGKILETQWQTHITSSSDVAYLPLKKKLLVTGGTNAIDVYEYSFFTQSWAKGTGKFETEKSNFILDIDENIKYYTTVGTDALKKWDDTSSSSSAARILTKDFTFGNPASRKKCFKFYVTYKSSAATNIKFYYGTNGKNLQTVDANLQTDLSTTAGDGDTFDNNPKVLRVATATLEVDDVVTGTSTLTAAKIPANSKVTKMISGSLLEINNDVTDNATDEWVTYSTKGREVSTTSTFGGTSTNCYTVDGLVTTGGEWKQAELTPPSNINNIYSIQLHFKSSGAVPADFEINDITIVYREKAIK